MAVVDVVDAYITSLPATTRRLSEGEWGIEVASEATGGDGLEIGVRLADGLLSAQAFVLEADRVRDPWRFLHFNRQTRLVRFACTRSGDIWVCADAPAQGLDEGTLDRFFGLLADAALQGRAQGERSG